MHGIPGDRVLAEGDVISIDCGAIVDGWHGDAAITVAVGGLDDGPRRRTPTAEVTEESLWRGMAAARLGGRLTDISHGSRATSAARATTASSRTTSATASAPRCTSRPTSPTSAGPAADPSWWRAWRSPWSRWSPSAATRPTSLDDEWTVATSDGSMAAHFEHTFTLTPNGPWVLTALDGGEARLKELGVPFGGR